MPKIARNKTVHNILIGIGILLGIALVVLLIINGRHYFTRRGIRQLQLNINSYGEFSPLAVLFLVFVTTVVPPIPIPLPLIEMATGYIYGFIPAFFLIWFSQIVSSLAAYGMSRFIGKRLMKKILSYPIVSFYQEYLKEHGAIAVFITRTTMSSPFSVVSFLSGLSDMKFGHYVAATILGTILESALFTYTGSIIRTTRLRLWFIFILVIILGAIGPLITFFVVKYVRVKRGKKMLSHRHTSRTAV